MAEKKKPFTLLSKNELYLVAGFFAFVLVLLIFTFYSPNSLPNNKPVEFEITKGETLEVIIDSLFAKEVIPSRFNMRVAVMLQGAGKKLKAGSYFIDRATNYFELIEILCGEKNNLQKRVTIPEGIEQPKLASLLKRELGIDSSEFIGLSSSKSFIKSLNIDADNLEGYLLPETYFLLPASGARGVLRKLKDEQEKIWTQKNLEQLKKLKMNKHQILTLAAIIDGESNVFREFARISGVYHNRLRKKMALQADPTIEYLIRNRKQNKITKKDLAISSPFNTYINVGLPPGPINNPGKQAIIAALYPEKNNFLYFVADGTGSHSFAVTYDEHTVNVGKYRRWLRTQN